MAFAQSHVPAIADPRLNSPKRRWHRLSYHQCMIASFHRASKSNQGVESGSGSRGGGSGDYQGRERVWVIIDLTMEILSLSLLGDRKTTLLKCIAELNVYQSGEILLHGQSVQSLVLPYPANLYSDPQPTTVHSFSHPPLSHDLK